MRDALGDALDALEEAVGDLNEYVRKKLGYDTQEELNEALMGLQVDSVAAAIHQMEARGRGVVIADQTGVGKGRQAAAIIRWAMRAGKVPVFVSFKDTLFSDMYRDLTDIGEVDPDVLVFNAETKVFDASGKLVLKMSPGKRRAAVKEIAAGGKLPEGFRGVFLTYSQINQANNQRKALMALAAREDVILVLDESHNAAGDSATGTFIRGLIEASKGVTYLSATFAKRPDNIPLYFRTDLQDAVDSMEELVDAMASGGLQLQTVISNLLTKAGQMFRRERSYNGIDIPTKVIQGRTAEHEAMSDRVTEGLRAIMAADRAFHMDGFPAVKDALVKAGGTVTDAAGNKASTSVNHATFSSVIHNFVRQYMLGIKADVAADEAIAAFKRGEKPIVAVENTMGSFLGEYVKENDLENGDPLTDYGWHTVLSRALRRTLRVKVKDPKGNESVVTVPIEDLPAHVIEMYEDAQALIDELDLGDIPASPIDWIRQRLEDAGIKTAEITGRDWRVDYSGEKPALARIDPGQKDKTLIIGAFNRGETDALVVNVAGSTGISLHASEKFKDQKQRHMIVAQPALDIAVFMQMLGRIHRTGQVKLPRYTILNVDLPSEIRPTAILNKKMKSLNANTSSNTESATSISAVDIINHYGDQIVSEFFAEPEGAKIAKAIGMANAAKEDDGDPMIDLAAKATGKISVLPVAMQKFFYAEVERRYRELIEYLDKTGQNDLHTDTLELDARQTESAELSPKKKDGSVFGGASRIGRYSVKRLGKPPSAADVKAAIDKTLDGKDAAEYGEELLKARQADFDKHIADLERARDEAKQASLEAGRDNEKADRARTRLERASRQVDAARELWALAEAAVTRRYSVGRTFPIEINGDKMAAVVTAIEIKKSEAGHPVSPSKITLTLSINSGIGTLKVPLTRAEKIRQAGMFLEDVDSLFSPARSADAREDVYIVTGNLVAAFGELEKAGRIINFTTEDGRIEQGILLPKSFDPGKHVKRDVSARTPEDARDFLLDNRSHPDVSRFGLATRDNTLRVTPTRWGGHVLISVPKAKNQGGKWYLDAGLIAIVGDFHSKGSRMTVEVPHTKVLDALRYIMERGLLTAPASLADKMPGYVAPEAAGIGGATTAGREEGGFEPIVTESGIQTGPESVEDALAKARLIVTATKDPVRGTDVWRVSGKTFPHREKMRAAGGEWRPAQQVWEFSSDPSAALAAGLGYTSGEGPAANEVREDAEPYTTDLFGQPVRPSLGRSRRARVGGDVRSPTPVPAQPDVDGTYFVEAAIVTEGERALPVEKVTTPEEAAQALEYLGDYATERFDGLVVDAAGRPLAIVGGNRGTIDGASVYHEVIAREAFSIAGAAGLWMAHNHPSGSPGQSNADVLLTKKIAGVLKGTGIEVRGMLAIGRDLATGRRNYEFRTPDGAIKAGNVSPISGKTTWSTPVVNRVITKFDMAGRPAVHTPADAFAAVQEMAGEKVGIVLLDNKHNVTGFVPVHPTHAGKLREGDRAARLIRALAKANAAATIVANPHEILAWSETQNLAGFLFDLGARPLDVITYVPGQPGGKSAADRGEMSPTIPFKSRPSSRVSTPAKGITAERARESVRKFRAAYRGPANLKVRIYSKQADHSGARRAGGSIKGGFDERSGEILLFADNLSGDRDAYETIRHEVLGHYGLRLFKPETREKILRAILASRNANPFIRRIWKEVSKSYEGETNEMVLAEEVFARIAERQPGKAELWWNKIVQMVAQALREVGLIDGLVSVSELRLLVEDIGAAIQAGKTAQLEGDGRRQSRNNDPVFFSQLVRTLEDKLPGKGRASDLRQQVRAWVRDGKIKPEEADWSGIDDWLASEDDRVLTKAEVVGFARAHQVVVEEFERSELAYELTDEEEAGARERAEAEYERKVRAQIEVEEEDFEGYSTDYISDIVPDEENGGYSLLNQDGEEVSWHSTLEKAQKEMERIEEASVKERDSMIRERAEAHVDRWYPLDRLVEAELDEVKRDKSDHRPSYGRWALPGGELYTELLLRIPYHPASGIDGAEERALEADIKAAGYSKGLDESPAKLRLEGQRELADRLKERNDKYFQGPNAKFVFSSNHWPKYNVVAHIRFSERDRPGGGRALHVEEIQSDWHQDGRKYGYQSNVPKLIEEAQAIRQKGWNEPLSGKDYRRLSQLERMIDEAPPDAPFKKSWHMLAIKRMLRYAAEHGFDEIVWTPGQEHADRYGLEKQIKSVQWNEVSGKFIARGHDDQVAIDRGDVDEAGLEDLLGKELAERLINSPVDLTVGAHVLTGVDLKVGGEGMKGFYDDILPKEVGKYVKKWGAKVEQKEIGVPAFRNEQGEWEQDDFAFTRVPALGVTITDAMRESVMQGQPLFRKDGLRFSRRKATGNRDLDELFGMAGLGGKASLAERVRDYLSSGWGRIRADLSSVGDNLRAGIFDKFNEIKALERRLLGGLPVEQSGYVAARLSTGLASVMRGIMLHGAPEWRDGIIQRKANSKGLLDVLAPVKDDIEDWLAWMVAVRAEGLMAQGRENLFEARHIAAGKALAGPAGGDKATRFQQVADDFAAFKRSILDLAENAGLIDGTTRPAWDMADWIPFYRVMEDDRTKGPRNARGLAGQSSGIRQLRGGESELNDPLENIIQNFAHLVDASLKNHAMLTIRDNFERFGILEELGPKDRMGKALVPLSEVKKHLQNAGVPIAGIPQAALQGIAKMWSFQAPTAKDVVRIMDGGKAKYYRVPDRALLKALTSVDEQAYNNLLMQGGRFFKRLLTGAVTADPAFIARNFVRDMLHAWTINEDGFRLGVDSIRGLAKTLKESGGSVDMLFAGASFMGGYLNANDPQEGARMIRRAMREKDFASSVLDTPVKVWDLYRRMGDSVENASREAVYEAALKKGKSKAAAVFEARDLMDYSMRGQWAAIRILTDLVPFTNARLQGLYKLGRSGAVPGPGMKARLVTKGMMIALASTLLMLANRDREEYEELEDWDKDMYWHFWVDGQHYRMPKPFEIGLIYGTVPERIFRNIAGLDTNKKSWDRLVDNVATTLNFDPTPQMVKPLIEIGYNRNSFTGRPIESMADEGKMPSARYHEGTSETARLVGDVVSDASGIGPKKIEHLVRGYLGTLGSYALGVSDLVVRKAQGKELFPVEMRADEIPVVSAFVRGDGPARSTVYQTEFYELLKAANEIHRTAKNYMDKGREDDADRLMTKHEDLLANRKYLDKTSRKLSAIRKQMDMIQLDSDLSPAEKRAQIDELLSQRNELTKEAVTEVRATAGR